MSAVVALAAGAAIGVKHALETDHLAAIATLVDGESRARPGLVGASWGVGHSLPIVVLAIALVALGVSLPDSAVLAVEGLVGLVLVGLGLRLLYRSVTVDHHEHDPAGHHAHLELGTLSLGRAHVHVDGDSFGVGVLHGVAGSGALVVLLVASTPTLASAGAFLAGFVALTVGTMAVVAAVWGRTLETALEPVLTVAAGCFGVLAGALLLAEVVPILL